ncbi:DUF4263 domain-containing protein [Variovorax sp. J22R133]|uniref:Shedu anti-phage system protein SduA domain-containing protein n=1 Tax=Variovorax brevis TaxID=3053503 RepID=UPI0025761C25|nr:Shedu anti-phage system protein SduA domain-containing protein [Variovorax sp. J22R133]MDM0111153.1 DUF4263 domain-containing protein [Variovorax sp. J22R133]
MDDEAEIHRKKISGKTYISPAVATAEGSLRIASKSLTPRALYGLIQPNDEDGNPTGESVFNFRPRAFIVAGSLGEFVSAQGVNTDKMRSFELYRNSIAGIDIMTFDELYERSKFIVEAAAMPTPSN